MSKHTPGEWRRDFADDWFVDYDGMGHFHYFTLFAAGRKAPVAFIPGLGTDDAETQANARLIAAAPELLAALKRCRAELDAVKDASMGGVPLAVSHLLPEAIHLAAAAIAKAEGNG